MRLIHTKDLRVIEFASSEIPDYAILSHTWEDEEVSYQQMVSNEMITHLKKGYYKILKVCQIAAAEHFDYVWIDTCCIDKTSSAELSEAINSMFNWYARATKCYVYLSDLAPNSTESHHIRSCRWLTRGWTLQELIAPMVIDFYDMSWKRAGTKVKFLLELADCTTIPESVLNGVKSFTDYPVASRMSWAAGRETSRVEDMAYCLLGIFEINMPLLYGEEERAFKRLQQEIVKNTNDLSILAWDEPSISPLSEQLMPLLARSPASFNVISGIDYLRSWISEGEVSITNKGFSISDSRSLFSSSLVLPGESTLSQVYLLAVGMIKDGFAWPDFNFVALRKVGPQIYCRDTRVPLFHRFPASNRKPVTSLKRFHIIESGTHLELEPLLYRHEAIHIPPQDYWEVVTTDHVIPTPVELWDHGDRLFLKSYHRNFENRVLAIPFEGEFGGTLVRIGVLILSMQHLPASEMPISTIIPRDESLKTLPNFMLFDPSAKEEGYHLPEILPHVPQLGRQDSEKMLFGANERRYEVSATFDRKRISNMFGPFDVISLKLRTREL